MAWCSGGNVKERVVGVIVPRLLMVVEGKVVVTRGWRRRWVVVMVVVVVRGSAHVQCNRLRNR